MDSGDWRYGQPDETWADPPSSGRGQAASGAQDAGAPSRDSAGRGGAPNLWADDTDGWGTTGSWLPAARSPEGGIYPADPEPSADPPAWQPAAPAWGQTDPGWNAPAPAEPWTSSGGTASASEPPAAPAASSWRQSAAAPAWGGQPATLDWGGGPVSSPPAPGVAPMPSRSEVATVHTGDQSSEGTYRRRGIDSWQRPEPTTRRKVAEEEEFPQRRRDPYGEEPAYGPVLGYTAGWYGIPAAFYLVWLITLDSDRQAFAGRQFVASLPWLFAAVVLSLAIAGMLRWAIVGWRALTLSFAAAVIGAGVTTIAHSLTL